MIMYTQLCWRLQLGWDTRESAKIGAFGFLVVWVCYIGAAASACARSESHDLLCASIIYVYDISMIPNDDISIMLNRR